jgi:hypothetical protein
MTELRHRLTHGEGDDIPAISGEALKSTESSAVPTVPTKKRRIQLFPAIARLLERYRNSGIAGIRLPVTAYSRSSKREFPLWKKIKNLQAVLGVVYVLYILTKSTTCRPF